MSDRTLRLLTALVALAGMILAAYLTSAHYAEGSLVCPVGGGCETVQESEYAEIAGVPVAVLGLGAYVVLLALVLWDAPTARLAAAAIALIGFMFSAYLLVIQAFVLDAFCVWCLVNDLVIAPALAVLTAIRLGDRTQERG